MSLARAMVNACDRETKEAKQFAVERGGAYVEVSADRFVLERRTS